MPPEPSIGPERRILTDHLVLRLPSPEDREGFVRCYEVSDAFFRPWEPKRSEHTDLGTLFEEQLIRSLESAEAGTGCRLFAFVRDPATGAETARIAGFFSLNNVVRGVFQNADAGWRISADCVGRGLGTEGVTALLDLAFAPRPAGLGLHRVQANVIPRNAASRRVAEKAGFRLEGLGVRMLEINGVWEDHLMHAKLADEHRFRWIDPKSYGSA